MIFTAGASPSANWSRADTNGRIIPAPRTGRRRLRNPNRPRMNAARFCTGWFFLMCAGSLAASTAVINIDVNQKGPALNPRLYGIFLENLNHAVDGGLYAELIQNRGFEDAKPPEGYIYHDGRWVDSLDKNAYDARFSRFGYFTNGLPFWSLVQDGGAQGSMNLDMDNPVAPESPTTAFGVSALLRAKNSNFHFGRDARMASTER